MLALMLNALFFQALQRLLVQDSFVWVNIILNIIYSEAIALFDEVHLSLDRG